MPSLIRRRGWEPAHFPWFTALVAGGIVAAFVLDERWSGAVLAGEHAAPITGPPAQFLGDGGSSGAAEVPGSESDAVPPRPAGTASLPDSSSSEPDPESALTVGVR